VVQALKSVYRAGKAVACLLAELAANLLLDDIL